VVVEARLEARECSALINPGSCVSIVSERMIPLLRNVTILLTKRRICGLDGEVKLVGEISNVVVGSMAMKQRFVRW